MEKGNAMKKRAGATSVGANREGGVAALGAQHGQTGVPWTSASLIAVAGELGRLLTRRELVQISKRRGYSLPEMLFGAAVMAQISLLVFRMWRLILH